MLALRCKSRECPSSSSLPSMAASATGATAAPLAAILRPACAFHLCALLCSSIGSVENPMITLYSYPELFGVADNNGYGLKVFAFFKLTGVSFTHEHILDASAAPRGQLPYIVDDGRTIGDSDTIIAHVTRKFRLKIDDGLTAAQRDTGHLITRILDD